MAHLKRAGTRDEMGHGHEIVKEMREWLFDGELAFTKVEE